MTPDELDKALEPYGQIPSDYTKDLQGTGLGLPLVKALAELHQGRLTVTSKKGQGTTAIVELPWNPDLPRPPQVTPLPPAAATPTGGGVGAVRLLAPDRA
jgi:K+-sensing histidine kinase KdpD